ncbi:MAG: hypothetical protein JW982_10275 [Spirochaetes bacterium]|nr:hypothetical protein [Spirochaetota bacterium]
MLKKAVFFIVFLSFSIPLFSFSDQTTTERKINENKEYISFMNVCISNFGSSDIETFFKVYEAHFNAEVAFLQSEYARSFKNVYQSQTIHDDLYNKVLVDYYHEHSKLILDKLAPSIIKSKNKSARLYLTLAYRDRSFSKNLQMAALATNPRQHSYRMYKLRDAIIISRRSMRYALLALFESQSIEIKKKIYDHLFEMEREKGNPFYVRFLSKTGEDYLKEYNRDFNDYEKEYTVELQTKKETYMEQNKDKSLQELQENDNSKYLFEKNVSRRLRFKMEQRTAEYLRNGEFDKANDIAVKYIDDYNFKLILAAIEILETGSKDEYPGFDFENLKTHHYDDFSRLRKDNAIDLFISRVKVVDDIGVNGKNTNPDKSSVENDTEGNLDKDPGSTVENPQ